MILLFNKMNLQYYKCEICEKVFIDNSELRDHLEHFHLVEPHPNNTALWRVGPKFGNAIPSLCSESCKWLHSHPYAAVFTEILKGLRKVLKDDVITKIVDENVSKRVEEWWKKKAHQEEDNEYHTDIDVSNGDPPKKKRNISGLLKEERGEYRMRTTLPTTVIDLCDSEDEENDYQELEYVDEEGNPVSIRENNSDLYEVANIEPDKLSNPANEDVLELDLDAELHGFQETSDLLTESPTPSKTFSTERHQKENLISLTSRKEQERPPPRLRKESRYSPEDYDKSNKDVSFSNQSHAPKIESRDSFGNDLEYDEESEDESIADDHRKRFKSELSSITLTPAKSRTDISDTLESVISIEKTAKVQAFLENEPKQKMRFKAKMQGRMKQPPRFQRPNQIFNVTQEQPTKQLSYYCSLDGHSKPKTSCCGTENKEIVSCSLDGSVNLWKVPVGVPDAHFTHESSITGLILSVSSDFALSSDGHGNLILWKIDVESPTSPLTYAGKKKYDQGFITGLLWLKCKKFACAVIELVESGERSILDIIEFNDSPQKMPLSLEVKKSYTFEREISCLDTCDQTDTILVGMKSGEVMYITPEAEHCYKMSNNLILCLCFYSKYKTSDHFYVSYVDGRVKMYSVQNLLSGKETINPEPLPLKTYEPPDSSDSSEFTSVMCCAKNSIVCGCSDGVLRIYDQSSLKFTKKIHDNLISGMSVIGSYLFTSSLDKTVKGWNLTSFKQVCQFDSAAPVSCLSSIKTDSKVSIQESSILVCGTTSGNFYIFQLTG